MVRNEFPEVSIIISNTVNKGFSAANNQAIKLQREIIIFLLNPDTIVEEDLFRNVLLS